MRMTREERERAEALRRFREEECWRQKFFGTLIVFAVLALVAIMAWKLWW